MVLHLQGPAAETARGAGAEIVGGAELIEKVQSLFTAVVLGVYSVCVYVPHAVCTVCVCVCTYCMLCVLCVGAIWCSKGL